jgi:PPK2 family polyphosphate:nucleotide phosphotransferase
MPSVRLDLDAYRFRPKKSRLEDFPPDSTDGFKSKEHAVLKLQRDIERLAKLQDVLYAQNDYALLVIFQAMDAAGKDSAIKHVMSGVNPQGCQVFSFKSPSTEELDHDYLWRCMRALPERGRIGIFNRSYYEEVLVVRVHPEVLAAQQLPEAARGKDLFDRRYRQIRDFERYLAENGIVILKFFLNVSKAEQKKRFLQRLEDPSKNWKFSASDVTERGHWKKYMKAYERAFEETSTEWAPWHIVPADNKWFTRIVVADTICATLERLKLRYPVVSKDKKNSLEEAQRVLLGEEDMD